MYIDDQNELDGLFSKIRQAGRGFDRARRKVGRKFDKAVLRKPLKFVGKTVAKVEDSKLNPANWFPKKTFAHKFLRGAGRAAASFYTGGASNVAFAAGDISRAKRAAAEQQRSQERLAAQQVLELERQAAALEAKLKQMGL